MNAEIFGESKFKILGQILYLNPKLLLWHPRHTVPHTNPGDLDFRFFGRSGPQGRFGSRVRSSHDKDALQSLRVCRGEMGS